MYEQVELAPVVKKVPFGSSSVEVTTYVQQSVKHPIPLNLTVDMYNVENSPNAEFIDRPIIRQCQTDQVYNSYLSLLDSYNRIKDDLSPEVAPEVAPVVNETPSNVTNSTEL